MNRRHSILASLLLVCVAPYVAYADQRPEVAHRIEIRGSLSSLSVRDDTLVPLAFTGPLAALGARYGVVVGPHAFDADLRAGFGLMWNRFGHIAAQIAHGAEVGYTYALVGEPDRRFALGAAARLDTSVSYLATWDDAHGYWLASAALWPTLVDARPLGRSAWLESRYEFALLGLASRPPAYRANKQDRMTHVGYFIDRIGESPRFVCPLRMQAIEFEVLARFRSTSQAFGTGWGVGVAVRFARDTFPAPYTQIYAGVLASYGFGL